MKGFIDKEINGNVGSFGRAQRGQGEFLNEQIDFYQHFNISQKYF